MAAARNVSAAAMTTERPSSLRRLAILARLVVFPEPLTPSTSITVGWPSARHRRAPVKPVEPLAAGPTLQLVQEAQGGLDAQVRADQDGFQLLQQLVVELRAAPEGGGDRPH